MDGHLKAVAAAEADSHIVVAALAHDGVAGVDDVLRHKLIGALAQARRDQKTDGREHRGKAAAVEHRIHDVRAGIGRKTGVHDRQNIVQADTLAEHRHHRARSDAGDKSRDRRLFHQNHHDYDQHGQKQHGAEPGLGGNGGKDILIHFPADAAAGIAQAVNKVENERNEIRRPRGNERVANAVHQRHLAHRGGDDGRVRQRRDLVTEERAGADRTRGRGQRHTETLCNAHAGDADRRERAPRRARHGGHQRAKDADDWQE